MAENVASTALRGFSNALSLVGERSAPPGVELGLPAQPLHDLTPYVRYGAAPIFQKFADGWVTAGISQTFATATFAATAILDWSAVVSGSFGISQNRLASMALWIYQISLDCIPTATADIGDSVARMNLPVGIGTASVEHALFLNKSNFVSEAALVQWIPNDIGAGIHWPVQWPAGQTLNFINQNNNANATTWRWKLRCRMLPIGVPPLP